MSVTMDVQVSGMSCGHCASAVTTAVGGLTGVEDVVVDVTTGTVTIVSVEPLAHEDLAAAVDDAGYALA